MTANSSIISVCNRALLASGAREQISSLTEQSVEAQTCNILYQPTFESLARTAWWNCLSTQNTLALLKAAQGTPENPQGTTLALPPAPWLYEYLQPTDGLHNRYIVASLPSNGISNLTTYNNSASTWLPGQDNQIKFKTAYDTDASGNGYNVILTNQENAQLVYTVNQPNPQLWDSQFEDAFVASLAAFLSVPLTLNAALMTRNIQIANGVIAQARASDGNEGTNTQNRQADWMRARRGSGVAGWAGGSYQYSGWSSMAWPG